MYSIYKYKLGGAEPISADVLEWLSVELDPVGEPCVWARVDVDSENKKFYCFNEIGTGWAFDDSENIGIYLGTLNEGPYVWHYFAQEITPTKQEVENRTRKVANELPLDEL